MCSMEQLYARAVWPLARDDALACHPYLVQMSLRLMMLATVLALTQGFMLAPLATRTPSRAVAPAMGYQDAAAACLEDGCSLDTVEDLLAELKAEKNPTAEFMKTINDLEALIGSPNADKNAIEKIVSAASRSFSVVGGFEFKGEPMGYTGKVGT